MKISPEKNKLGMLYLLHRLDLPVSDEQMAEFFTAEGQLNYFELQQLRAELCETGHLARSERRGRHYCRITEKGREAVTLFKKKIHVRTLSKIDRFVEDNSQRLRNESQLEAEVLRAEDGSYQVSLKVLEMDQPVMEIILAVPQADQAKAVASAWKDHAKTIYKHVLTQLIPNQPSKDPSDPR